MKRALDFLVACYVTFAGCVNAYLAVKFWREWLK